MLLSGARTQLIAVFKSVKRSVRYIFIWMAIGNYTSQKPPRYCLWSWKDESGTPRLGMHSKTLVIMSCWRVFPRFG